MNAVEGRMTHKESQMKDRRSLAPISGKHRLQGRLTRALAMACFLILLVGALPLPAMAAD